MHRCIPLSYKLPVGYRRDFQIHSDGFKLRMVYEEDAIDLFIEGDAADERTSSRVLDWQQECDAAVRAEVGA